MRAHESGGAVVSGLGPGPAPSVGSPSRPRGDLRLVAGPAEVQSRVSPRSERLSTREASTVELKRGHVLVVGVDSRARADMLCELREVLPGGTRFVETQETWEALTLAESSQMVVLVGDLEGLSGASMVRLLARRQPTLPVLAVAGEACAASPRAAHG
ncbi:MAG: hypothetical protein WB998_10280 [Solirubrobacteraceae bacterium]